ncbi:hypothetical protein THZG08_230028 [Vibrio owensii]|nr:hypothetical protein THZG08_230028 [Vibrio owensii]CAH1561426.1 hypothetical protein THOA03_230028 [Vibrio owensii]
MAIWLAGSSGVDAPTQKLNFQYLLNAFRHFKKQRTSLLFLCVSILRLSRFITLLVKAFTVNLRGFACYCSM